MRYWLTFYIGGGLLSLVLPAAIGFSIGEPLWRLGLGDGSLYVFSLATTGGGCGSYLYAASRPVRRPPPIWLFQVVSFAMVLGAGTLTLYVVKILSGRTEGPELASWVEPWAALALASAATLYALSCEARRQLISYL